jgi:hypothetical protein
VFSIHCKDERSEPVKRLLIISLSVVLVFLSSTALFGQDTARFQVGGDFRLQGRYDNITDEASRTRMSLRFRLNTTLLVYDKLFLFFGFATGTGDPRSRNLAFDDFFSTKPFWIDHVYLEWRLFNQLVFLGGKMRDPFWRPTSFFWDGYITPEGIAIQGDTYTFPLSIFYRAGVYVVDEIQSLDDPLLVPIQAGFEYAFENGNSIKFGGTFYLFNNLKNIDTSDPNGSYSQYSPLSNSYEGNSLKYGYNSAAAGAEVFFTNVLPPYIPTVTLVAESIYNFDPPTENIGYLAGITLGHLDVFSLKEWRVFYAYVHLARDSVLDIFPESTYFSGATNISGHSLTVDIGVANRIWIRLQFASVTEIIGNRNQLIGVADLNLRF